MRKVTVVTPIPQETGLRVGVGVDRVEEFLALVLVPFARKVRSALNQTLLDVTDLRTTDATATVIWSGTVVENTGLDIDFAVSGFATDGSYAAYRRLTRVKRAGSAAPTILGTDTIGTDREDIAGWTVSVARNGNVLEVSVTGAAGQTVDWVCRATIQQTPRPKLPAPV